MKRFFVLAAIATFCLAMSLTGSGLKPALAEDFSSLNGAPKWKLYTYHDVGPNPALPAAKVIDGGGIGFAFLPSPNTSMLVTSHKSYQGTLLGNLSEKTVSANISIPDAVIPTSFSYYNTGGTRVANVRFYFQTAVDPHCEPSGQFVAGSPCESQYWWSNPESIDLATLALSGSVTTLTALLNREFWSDRDGHSGDLDEAHREAFAAAVGNVQLIGLSFGGGNNFAFGVGVSSGSATFHLLDFSVN